MRVLSGAASHPNVRARTLKKRGINLPGDVLDALPVGICVCDSDGLLLYYNERAVAMWGRQPKLRDPRERFCGSHKLYRVDGGPMAHQDCPIADVVRTGIAVRDSDVIIERPDATRLRVRVDINALKDKSGEIIGAAACFRDIADHSVLERAQARIDAYSSAAFAAQRLAAIVESSDDAILAKDLNGIIMSWNAGAERLFGYTAQEMIGSPVLRLIPEERHAEETEILGRIRRGERIEHFETIRRRKDGSEVEISLTVSPVKDDEGRLIGASKIARDITERRRTERQLQLVINEMDHRAKNLFALASGIVTLSMPSAGSADDLAKVVRARLDALARAHALTLPGSSGPASETTLHKLIATIVAPYDDTAGSHVARVRIDGVDSVICAKVITPLALLLHEFTTNAAKYGALSTAQGQVFIVCRDVGDAVVIGWTERGGPALVPGARSDGFGSRLAQATVKDQLGGEIRRDWQTEGLSVTLTLPRARLAGEPQA